MAAMLRGLVADIADELIGGLPAIMAAQADAARDGPIATLRNAGLLERHGLVALLLRRADEQQLSARMDRGADASVAALVGDEDAAVAETAMALTLARGRRRDRFGRPGHRIRRSGGRRCGGAWSMPLPALCATGWTAMRTSRLRPPRSRSVSP